GALPLGGDDDHRNLGELWVRSQEREQLVSGHARHREVEQHGGGRGGADLRQGLRPVAGGGAEVERPQRGLLVRENGVAVVDQQKAGQAHGRGGAASSESTTSANLPEEIGLVTKALAPASIALVRTKSASSPVSRITGVERTRSSASWRRVLPNSSPSIPGSLMAGHPSRRR